MKMYHRKQQIDSRAIESILERVLTEKIARDLNVKPEDVTPEFIEEWRKKNLYPLARLDMKTLYGGYIGHGRRALTGRDVESMREAAEAFLNSTTGDVESGS